MFAASSTQVGGFSEVPAAVGAQHRSLAKAVGHGLVVGAVATILQLVLFFVLLYAAGIFES